jgi:Flp pilus assembly protein TadG
MKRIAEKSIARHRGAVLVEMVIVTPILLFIMMATAELTRAFIDHNTLTKAVRTGVRYVAANAFQGTTGVVSVSAALRAETQNLIVYGNSAGTGTPVLAGLTAADITVTNIGADNIQVSAVHTISGMLGPLLRGISTGPDINMVHNLEATVTMRAL